jgi:sigma-B regulation protein RsbU (phosphoserine phosphatase)
VTLKPARQTSGDFYDVTLLPNGGLAMLVADVADKGAGAALYMALSWTLIRTYIPQYPTEPELVLSAANRRILMDTAADRFVTVFYAVLDPPTGRLTYCNAGHNPPLLIPARRDGHAHRLTRTGMPLGIFEDGAWEQGVAQLAPGDMLLLYTDGIPDTQNAAGEFFGEVRLLTSARASLGSPAQDIRDSIVASVHEFAGDAPQLDDIALLVIVRD